MNTIISIDTTQLYKAVVSLKTDDDIFTKEADSQKYRSQMVLPLINELLAEHSLSLSDISEITVNPGPGSFTGIRVGTTIAATLSFILSIPLNGSVSPALPAITYQNDH